MGALIQETRHVTPPSLLRHDREVQERRRGRIDADGIPDQQTVQKDLRELALLQESFNQALGLKEGPGDLLKRSYNPVVDRWHIERLREEGNVEGEQEFKREMRENMRTDMMERLHTVESFGTYSIKDGQLYSEHFPNENFEEILTRGVEYRREKGSQELEREGELGELAGWKKINDVMTDSETPLETKVYSLSPRGIAKGTAYEGWFVDEYILKKDADGEKYVDRRRVGVEEGYEDFREMAESIDPHYFDEYDGRPLDAWYLSHPLIGDLEVNKKGFSVEYTNDILNNSFQLDLDSHYEAVISAEEVDWGLVARAHNARLNHVDFLKKKREQKSENVKSVWYDTDDRTAFLAQVKMLGEQRVATVRGGGCPPNMGIQLGGGSGINSGFELFSNSVGKFGIDGDRKVLCCTCPFCKKQVEAVISSGTISCPECAASAPYQEQVSGE